MRGGDAEIRVEQDAERRAAGPAELDQAIRSDSARTKSALRMWSMM